ncbi:hypothetical protein IB260_21675 [Pseudomonas sp. PDM23]|uniref:ABC-three component system protein n=1 Tax=unclassified Pseudomonas TaxID=196821 RepID=UPI001784A8B2|nr:MULTISPECIES: ABC-three component system protein [unclassified Pseudomonas]MBD9577950.1 hypothetical protein [Pseudomonas sp. PDM23]MBD9672508.1 hypothetical protein [Pseudomonas sp. PDM21]
MKYQYCELSHIQFESLVVHLCYRLFGIGTESFAEGVDGGRDSRFDGVAEKYPSTASPWKGLTVVQAKHTIAYNKKFSDSDFFGGVSSDINLEVEKIKRLIREDGLSNYILFSNRKLPANANESIKNYISSETGLPKHNVGLVGVEALERYWKIYPEIPEEVGLNPFDMPLNIEPDELSQVIVAISSGLKFIASSKSPKAIIRTDFERKNQINDLSQQYSSRIKSKIAEMAQVEEFLAVPDNEEYQRLYIESSEELSAKISALRRTEQSFDIVIERVIDLLIERDVDLKSNKALTRMMIYYMYYHCDIGDDDAVVA